MKMNRYTLCMAAAALFAALALTGCSLLKVAVATGDPLSKEEMNIRTMTRGFYYDMASEVSRTADSIAAAAPDIATRVAAVRWKIRATRAGVSAAMQGIPDVALADMWILCRRMDEGFAAAPDSLLFGAQSDLARDAAAAGTQRPALLLIGLHPGNNLFVCHCLIPRQFIFSRSQATKRQNSSRDMDSGLPVLM